MLMILAELSAIVIGATLGAIIVMVAARPRKLREKKPARDSNTPQGNGAVFLFQGDILVDATNDAWAIIKHRAQNLRF